MSEPEVFSSVSGICVTDIFANQCSRGFSQSEVVIGRKPVCAVEAAAADGS